jgi:hypothetical protein
MLWRDMRGRTKEIHKELQDLDSKMFPSLRGEIDWWSCRFRSSLSNPSTRFKKYGRDREELQALEDQNNGGERESNQPAQGGRRGLFIGLPQNMTVTAI